VGWYVFQAQDQVVHDRELMLNSEVLHSVLLPSSTEWIAPVHQSVVGLLHHGSTVVSGVHAIQLLDLQTTCKILER